MSAPVSSPPPLPQPYVKKESNGMGSALFTFASVGLLGAAAYMHLSVMTQRMERLEHTCQDLKDALMRLHAVNASPKKQRKVRFRKAAPAEDEEDRAEEVLLEDNSYQSATASGEVEEEGAPEPLR